MPGAGNISDYGMRMYDARVGRFFPVDPLAPGYPWYTPYQRMEFYQLRAAENREGVISPTDLSWEEALAVWKGTPVELVPAFVRVRVKGTNPDFVEGQDFGILHYVSSRLMKVIMESGLSGLRFTPTHNAETGDESGYWVVTVSGRCGNLDASHESLRRSRLTGGLVQVIGAWFDVGRRDGSDFFLAENYLGLLCTSRAVRRLQEANITGWEAVPHGEIRRVCPV